MSKQILAHGFTEDMVNITQIYVKSGHDVNKIRNEANDIIESMQHTLIQIHQRKVIDGSLGRWFCLKKKNASYFALGQPGYPERIAYSLLSVYSIGIRPALRTISDGQRPQAAERRGNSSAGQIQPASGLRQAQPGPGQRRRPEARSAG